MVLLEAQSNVTILPLNFTIISSAPKCYEGLYSFSHASFRMSKIVRNFNSRSQLSAFLSIYALLSLKWRKRKNVKGSVAFQCVTEERRKKLFSSRPVIFYSVSNVTMKWNYDIRITMKSQRTDAHCIQATIQVFGCDHSLKGKYSLAAAMEGFGFHAVNKEFSFQSRLNSHTFTFLSVWST
jgi:hypothetical protein